MFFNKKTVKDKGIYEFSSWFTTDWQERNKSDVKFYKDKGSFHFMFGK